MKLFKTSYRVNVDKQSIDQNEETFNIYFEFSDDVKSLIINDDIEEKMNLMSKTFDSIFNKVKNIYRNCNIRYKYPNDLSIVETRNNVDIDSILEPISKSWSGEQQYKIKQEYWDSTVFPEIMNALDDEEKYILAIYFKTIDNYKKYIKSDKIEDIIYDVVLNEPESLNIRMYFIKEDINLLSKIYKAYTGKDILDSANNSIEELRKLSYEAISSVVNKAEYKDMFEPLSKNSGNGLSDIEINPYLWTHCALHLRPTENLLNKLKTKELKKKQLVSIMTDMGNEIEKF